MIDVATLPDDKLRVLIENHRTRGATDQPLYAEAMMEYHRRNAPKLKLDTSIDYIRSAAAQRRFISYGELAEANGASWGEVRYPMNEHLWVLVDYGHRKGGRC